MKIGREKSRKRKAGLEVGKAAKFCIADFCQVSPFFKRTHFMQLEERPMMVSAVTHFSGTFLFNLPNWVLFHLCISLV